MFCNLEVDVFLSGQGQNLAGQGVLVAIKPLGSSDKCIVFLQLLETVVGAALLANSDDIANLNHVGGDVNALAVDGVVTVVDELTSFTTGRSKAEAINNVIQAALDEAQQEFAGVAFCTSCLLIILVELLFQDAVYKLYLLLSLGKL